VIGVAVVELTSVATASAADGAGVQQCAGVAVAAGELDHGAAHGNVPRRGRGLRLKEIWVP
jgi:hypothetical protein